ncbi:MAG: Spy/CpxP family protein refolding chaperone [Rubripirellula sp.]
MNLKMIGAIALAALIATPVLAQDEAAGKKRKRGGQQNAGTQLIKQLQDVGLTDEQTAKIKELGKVIGAKMKSMKEDAGITAELTKKRAEIQKAMKDSDLKGKDLMAAINEKAGFTEAQAAALKAVNEVRVKFQKEVVGMLSDEQKAKLPERLQRSGNAGKGKGKNKKKSDE